MDTIITDLEEGLQAQLTALVESVRDGEEKILRNKEGYFKVQGALEILAVLKQRKVEQENEETKEDLTVEGVD
jgi:hypothetical protein